jgi:hypothetical protein
VTEGRGTNPNLTKKPFQKTDLKNRCLFVPDHIFSVLMGPPTLPLEMSDASIAFSLGSSSVPVIRNIRNMKISEEMPCPQDLESG